MHSYFPLRVSSGRLLYRGLRAPLRDPVFLDGVDPCADHPNSYFASSAPHRDGWSSLIILLCYGPSCSVMLVFCSVTLSCDILCSVVFVPMLCCRVTIISVTLCHAMICSVKVCYVMLGSVLLCCVLSFSVLSCSALVCSVMLCYVLV